MAKGRQGRENMRRLLLEEGEDGKVYRNLGVVVPSSPLLHHPHPHPKRA